MRPPVATELRDGFRDILPVALIALPIGLLFGALAAAKGLSAVEAALMSLLVNAGSAQFAALDLWGTPPPLLAILASTGLINLRLVLMGLSLAPKLAGFPPVLRASAAIFLTDQIWAFAERRATLRPVTPAYWFAQSALFTASWAGATLLGARIGPLLGAPHRIGADFALTALLIGMTAHFWRSRGTAVTIAASAAASTAAYLALGTPWHVLAGAAAGIAAAYARTAEA